MKKQLIQLLLGIALVVLPGCVGVLLVGAAAGVGAGAVYYSKGELKATDVVTLDRSWEAAQSGLKDLGLVVLEKQKDPVRARVTSRAVGDKSITIGLESQGEKSVTVKIRVGTFGDQALSLKILEAMRKRY